MGLFEAACEGCLVGGTASVWVFCRASRVGFVLAMALMVWSGTLLTPAGASASAVYYSVDVAQRMLPFSIGADGSLSPIACSGSNCATSDDPNGEAVTPNGRFLYVSGYSGTISAFASVPTGR